MFFSKPPPLINSFTLSVSSSRIDKTVAYGPGSCINGSLSLNNSQLLDVYELSVLFQCQIKQNNTTSTFFKVKEIILNKKKEYHGCKVEAGNHLYLFAIQLPINNYPPTILNETFAGEYEIEYTLQGYLEHSSTHTIIQTNSHPIIYLPLINVIQDKTFNAQSQQVYTRTSSSSLSSSTPPSSSIEITAKLLQPSFCPGELCSLQINTKNTTDAKIEQFYITIITHLQTDQIIKQHMLYNQPFQVAIPKQTVDHATTLSFLLPYMSLPTCHYNENDVCIIIKHEMIIGLSPTHHQQRLLIQQDQDQQQQPTSPTSLKRFSTSSWLQSFYSSSSSSFNSNNNNNTNPSSPSATAPTISPPLLSFPILITTVPIQSLLNQAKRPSIPVIFEESPSSTDLTSTETILCKSTPLPKFIPTSTSPLLRSHLITDTDTEEEDDDVLSADLNNQFDKYSVSPSSSFQLDCMSKNNSIINNNNQDSILSFSDNHKNVSTHLMVPTKSHSGISNVVE